MDIVCVAFPSFEGRYVKSTVELMKQLAARHRVLYVDYAYTWKDFWVSKDKYLKQRMLGLRARLVVHEVGIDTQLWVLTLPPILPAHFIRSRRLYDFVMWLNHWVVLWALRRAMRRLGFDKPFVINAFNPFLGNNLLGKLNEQQHLYYCYDEISACPWVQRHGARLEDKFAAAVDGIVVSSDGLFRSKHLLNSRCFVVKNGVNQAFFTKRFLINSSVMGYVGSLDGRVNYDLLETVARQFSEMQLVLIGGIVEENQQVKTGIARLRQLPNVTFTGTQTPQQVISHLQSWAIGLIPFVKNSQTAAIYPLKINEYLAVGLPVVSTHFAPLNDFKEVVALAEYPEEFCEQIRHLIQTDTPANQAKRVAVAQHNTWTQRAETLEGIMGTVPTHAPQSLPFGPSKRASQMSLVAHLMAALAGFGSMLVLLRTHSAADFGQWTLYVTIFTLFDMMRSGLVQNAFVRLWVAAPSGLYTLAAGLLGGIFTIIAILVLITVHVGWALPTHFTLPLTLLMLVSLPYSLLLWQHQAERRFDEILRLRCWVTLPFLCFLLVGFVHPLSIVAVAYCQVFLTAVVALRQYRWILNRTTANSPHAPSTLYQCLRQLWQFGQYSIGTLLGTNLLKSTDTFLLGAWYSAAAVALYQLPYKLIEVVEIPLRSQVATLLPIWSESSPEVVKVSLQKQLIRLTLWVLPLSSICFWGAEDLLSVLGGQSYAESVILLQLFAIYSLFLPADRLLGVALEVLGKPSLNTLKVWLMVMVNVLGDLYVLSNNGPLWQLTCVTVATTALGTALGTYFVFGNSRFSLISKPQLA